MDVTEVAAVVTDGETRVTLSVQGRELFAQILIAWRWAARALPDLVGCGNDRAAGGGRGVGSGFGSSAAGLLAGNTELLAALPQALATDTKLLGQLGLAHGVLVLEHEAGEVVFQGQVLARV